MTIFKAIARNRPEWIAQGLLMHAVVTEQKVRALLIEKSRRRDLEKFVDERPQVVEEERVEGRRWRADVVVSWRKVRRPLRMELKLLAGFTPAQREALDLQKVDLIVALSRSNTEKFSVPTITWSEVARRCRSEVLRVLLAQIPATSFGLRERLEREVLRREFADFRRGGDGGRHAMRSFLATVHLHLDDIAGTQYDANAGWSHSRGRWPYYGFDFRMRDTHFWLGFAAKEKTPPAFSLAVWRPETRRYETFKRWNRYVAKPLALEVVQYASIASTGGIAPSRL